MRHFLIHVQIWEADNAKAILSYEKRYLGKSASVAINRATTEATKSLSVKTWQSEFDAKDAPIARRANSAQVRLWVEDEGIVRRIGPIDPDGLTELRQPNSGVTRGKRLEKSRWIPARDQIPVGHAAIDPSGYIRD